MGAVRPLFNFVSMKPSTFFDIVSLPHFINSTRDSGYKSTSSALAELVDNSLEAGARNVTIKIKRNESSSEYNYLFSVVDDGSGMEKEELLKALQFGGSSRYNNRSGLGRYGMGLPNASLSQTKRVEVYTWKSIKKIYWSYLDVDEISTGKIDRLVEPQEIKRPDLEIKSTTGTIVNWLKCDRIDYKNLKSLIKRLHKDLGRIFRIQLWAGKKIYINDESVNPVDPLFFRKGNNLIGAKQFGQELIYEIKIPNNNQQSSSVVKVLFTELPLEDWSKFSNDIKSENGITKQAGISILRADREIDYGWYFTGNKRKENYDDWWRCEISFSPDLDELFGVTHTKQEIRPTEAIKNIITADIESTARFLNNRVRDRFIQLKQQTVTFPAKTTLEKTNGYLDPPNLKRKAPPNKKNKLHVNGGLEYRISLEELVSDKFFITKASKDYIELKINVKHPFYTHIYSPLLKNNEIKTDFRKNLEILIFAAARAESLLKGENQPLNIFKENWGKALSAFLS